MSIQKCHECGKDISPEADHCSNCSTAVKPAEIKPIRNRNMGCLVTVVIVSLLIIYTFGADIYSKRQINAKQQKLEKEVDENYEKDKNSFIKYIEHNYKELVNCYKRKDFDSATGYLDNFRKYGQLTYKDVSLIDVEISIQKAKNETSRYRESCYQLGFRYGRCGAMALKGYKCDPADDIIVPVECRGKSDTDKGTRDGVASVW